MKNKASGLLKQIISVVTTIVKAKSLALKRKTNALRARLIIFSLISNKKILLSSITQKLQALTEKRPKTTIDNVGDELESDDGQRKAIVLHEENYNCDAMSHEPLPNTTYTQLLEAAAYDDEEEEDDEDKYPDLTHSLFDEEDGGLGGSVIEMVKNSKQDQGEEFVLEDEIDHVADLFIQRFHRQIRIQKQLSFKRYQEMLQRGV